MKQELLEHAEQNKVGKPSGVAIGGFFILMGAIFYLAMSGASILGGSAWLLVALLPVYWIVVTAYKRYQPEGRITRSVFSILVFGLLPFIYIAAIILGISVSAIWPIGLIAVGVSFLFFGVNR